MTLSIAIQQIFEVLKQCHNLKTRAAMNAKISVLVICVEAIIYLLYNLHDCIFKIKRENISLKSLLLLHFNKVSSKSLGGNKLAT